MRAGGDVPTSRRATRACGKLLFQRTIPASSRRRRRTRRGRDCVAQGPGRVPVPARVSPILPEALDILLDRVHRRALTNQQIANDPGGDRWGRLVDRTVEHVHHRSDIDQTRSEDRTNLEETSKAMIETTTDEIADNVFRFSTFVPDSQHRVQPVLGACGAAAALPHRLARPVPARVRSGGPGDTHRRSAVDRVRSRRGRRMRRDEPVPRGRPARDRHPRRHRLHGLR